MRRVSYPFRPRKRELRPRALALGISVNRSNTLSYLLSGFGLLPEWREFLVLSMLLQR
jgi:hypothetical protein